MSINTLVNLSEQYQSLRIQVELAETDLEQARRSGYPLEVERLEKVVSDLRDEKEAVNLAISTIAAKENARTEKEERIAKWKETRALAREAKETLNRLTRELEARRREYDIAVHAAGNAEILLGDHNRSLLTPADFPLDAELDEEKKQGEKLTAALEKARAALRIANIARGTAQREALDALGRLNNLAASERRLRPPEQNPPGDEFRVMSIG